MRNRRDYLHLLEALGRTLDEKRRVEEHGTFF